MKASRPRSLASARVAGAVDTLAAIAASLGSHTGFSLSIVHFLCSHDTHHKSLRGRALLCDVSIVAAASAATAALAASSAATLSSAARHGFSEREIEEIKERYEI